MRHSLITSGRRCEWRRGPALAIIGVAISLAFPTAGLAQKSTGLFDDPRVAAAQRAYVTRCTPDLSSQGLPALKAEAACTCAASGILTEVNFGTPGDQERYARIMRADPNPNGSPDDQRLYKILAPCFSK
jgi:hypothetical protein